MRKLVVGLLACISIAVAGCDTMPERDPGYHIRDSSPAACETSPSLNLTRAQRQP